MDQRVLNFPGQKHKLINLLPRTGKTKETTENQCSDRSLSTFKLSIVVTATMITLFAANAKESTKEVAQQKAGPPRTYAYPMYKGGGQRDPPRAKEIQGEPRRPNDNPRKTKENLEFK